MGKRGRAQPDGGQKKRAKQRKTAAKDQEVLTESQRAENHKRDCYRLGAFPLLALPGELRNRVYEFALVCQKILIEEYSTRRCLKPGDYDSFCKTPEEQVANTQTCLDLLRVSRQVRNESRPIFYGKNVFHFSTSLYGNANSVLTFLELRPDEVLRNWLQQIHIGPLAPTNWPSFQALGDFLAQQKLPLRYLGLLFEAFVPIVTIEDDGSWAWQWADMFRHTSDDHDAMQYFLSALRTAIPTRTLALMITTPATYMNYGAPRTQHPTIRHAVAFMAFLRSKLLLDAEKFGLGERGIEVERTWALREDMKTKSSKDNRRLFRDPKNRVVSLLKLQCKDNSQGRSLLEEGGEEVELKRREEMALAEKGPFDLRQP
ncbi:hypothetical protein BU16DRAFT_554040 [Lophium mytilinum]|uniref:Uncharacterized protein n=1 Tax=Lophium mytilinum TaxID=390894 RepID=A0A6A6RC77_9PEZI|nr:hypothetical protein BU16DRAFT_554040 [Lophium mytilinum]